MYVGKTGRPLNKGVEEHKKAIRTANIIASVLAEHVCEILDIEVNKNEKL